MARSTGLWRLTKAPAIKRSVKGKAGEAYDYLHALWRAGVLEDFGYRPIVDDGPIVWSVNGHTWAKEDHAGAREFAASIAEHAGIVSASLGERWCGFQELILTLADGSIVRQSYNGWQLVAEVIPGEVAA